MTDVLSTGPARHDPATVSASVGRRLDAANPEDALRAAASLLPGTARPTGGGVIP